MKTMVFRTSSIAELTKVYWLLVGKARNWRVKVRRPAYEPSVRVDVPQAWTVGQLRALVSRKLGQSLAVKTLRELPQRSPAGKGNVTPGGAA